MFGFTKLTEQEKIDHTRKRRLVELYKLIQKESEVREVSLARAQTYQDEYDSLSKG